MKVLDRVLEKKIRCQVSIDNMQFGFMHAEGITDTIDTIMRQVQEKHQTIKKKVYYAFVDLERHLSPERGGEMGFEEAGCG